MTAILAGLFSLFGFGLSIAACFLVMRTGIVDAPDGGRKKQARAIPRTGGVAIALGALIGLGCSAIVLNVVQRGALGDLIATFPLMLVFVLTGAAFLIGLWDDIWTANTKLKLLLLAGISGAVVAAGVTPDALTSPFGDLAAPWLLVAGTTAWFLVFINAANFMDGSNGLSVGALLIMLIGLALTGTLSGDWSFSYAWFPLIGAILGFLALNLRGSLYAGDAGALGLGAVFAGLGIISGLEVWTVATLALPFLLDVLLTLIWRAKHGRNWLAAHLDHAYQRLIAAGWSHLETAVLYWGLSAVCAAMAYIAAVAGGAAPFAVFWTLGLAGAVLWSLHRRSAKISDLGR
ncbi:MAG: hypothetical protein AAFO74_00775 [Pseudomonadota bacterium]